MATKIKDEDLVVHILNVGNGDNMIIQFPVDDTGKRSYGVVDCNRKDAKKTIGYLNKLIPEKERSRLKFVCATHPHKDHIYGLDALLTHPTYKPYEFWDSGFRHNSNMYKNILEIVAGYLFSLPLGHKKSLKKSGAVKADIKKAFKDEKHPLSDKAKLEKITKGVWEIRDGKKVYRVEETGSQLNTYLVEKDKTEMVRVSSGMEWYFGKVRITALAPSVLLRNKYATYGVDMNNASIVLRLEHHKDNVLLMRSREYEGDKSAEALRDLSQAVMILGGDAEFDSWAQISIEYPQLIKTKEHEPLVNKMVNFLNCGVLKVPHHGSMHSAPLDMCEKLDPEVAIVSCNENISTKKIDNKRKYTRNLFPHPSTIIALTECKSKIITTDGAHESEIMKNGKKRYPELANEGSIVVIMPPEKKPQIIKLEDVASKVPNPP